MTTRGVDQPARAVVMLGPLDETGVGGDGVAQRIKHRLRVGVRIGVRGDPYINRSLRKSKCPMIEDSLEFARQRDRPSAGYGHSPRHRVRPFSSFDRLGDRLRSAEQRSSAHFDSNCMVSHGAVSHGVVQDQTGSPATTAALSASSCWSCWWCEPVAGDPDAGRAITARVRPVACHSSHNGRCTKNHAP